MNGSGSARTIVLDGGRGILGGSGQSTVSWKGSVPTSRHQVAGCLASHGCLRDLEVEIPSGQCWSQGLPTSRYLPSRLLLGMYACCGLGDEAGARLCLQRAVFTGCSRADLSRATRKTARSAPSAASQRGVVCHDDTRSATLKSGQARNCAKGQTTAAKGREV